MTEIITPEPQRKQKIATVVFMVFISLFAIYYIVLSVTAFQSKVSAINREYGYRKPEKGGYNDSIFKDSAFIALNRQKAFYQAQLAMAHTDSVTMAVNLPDSTVNLEINGVIVYTVKINKVRISSIFSKADEYAVLTLLSKPFVVTKDYSTIEKEPVVHKVAPKDSSEYKPETLPDTSRIEYVNFIFLTDKDIKLYVYQETSGKFMTAFRQFLFDLADRLRTSAYTVKCMVLFRKPDYQPYIKLRIPDREVKIIYRALPEHAQFAVCR